MPGAASPALAAAAIEDMKGRQLVYDRVLAGDVGGALAAVAAQYGESAVSGLAAGGLLFKLRVQQFVELVRQGPGAVAEALEFGRLQLGPAAATEGG